MTLSSTITGLILDSTDVEFAGRIIYEGSYHMFDMFKWLTVIHRTGGVELLLLWETFLMIIKLCHSYKILPRYPLGRHAAGEPAAVLLHPDEEDRKEIPRPDIPVDVCTDRVAAAILLINVSAKGMDELVPGYPYSKIGLACIFLFLATPRVLWGLMDWLSLGVEVVEILNAAPLSMGALTMDEMKVERAVIVEEPALDGV